MGNQAAKEGANGGRKWKGKLEADDDDVIEVPDNPDVEKTSIRRTGGDPFRRLLTDWTKSVDAHGAVMDRLLQQQTGKLRLETLKIVADSHTAAGLPIPPEVLHQMREVVACGASALGGVTADSGKTPAKPTMKEPPAVLTTTSLRRQKKRAAGAFGNKSTWHKRHRSGSGSLESAVSRQEKELCK